MECSIQTLGIFALADHQVTDELKPTVKPVLTSPAKTRGSPLPISSLAAPRRTRRRYQCKCGSPAPQA
jgi:hypothetical protein